MEKDKVEKKIIKSIRILWKKDFLAAGDGNFSYKDPQGEIWISPSGCRKCDLKTGDFVPLKSSSASSESKMHRHVYESSHKANFVFHAHPPAAVAYSISSDQSHLPLNLISELVLSAGKIPIVPYARPGSNDMGTNLLPFLPESRILLLKHHGALTWGESVEEALNGMERLEHSCKIFVYANTLGRPQNLTSDEVTWLIEKRKELGEKVL